LGLLLDFKDSCLLSNEDDLYCCVDAVADNVLVVPLAIVGVMLIASLLREEDNGNNTAH
jgi:hypothetical protein